MRGSGATSSCSTGGRWLQEPIPGSKPFEWLKDNILILSIWTKDGPEKVSSYNWIIKRLSEFVEEWATFGFCTILTRFSRRN